MNSPLTDLKISLISAFYYYCEIYSYLIRTTFTIILIWDRISNITESNFDAFRAQSRVMLVKNCDGLHAMIFKIELQATNANIQLYYHNFNELLWWGNSLYDYSSRYQAAICHCKTMSTMG